MSIEYLTIVSSTRGGRCTAQCSTCIKQHSSAVTRLCKSLHNFQRQPCRICTCLFALGEEIARHIAREAKHVYHSARTFTGAGTAREPAQAAQAPLGSAPQQEAVRLDSYEVVAANCLQAKANPNGLSQPGKIPQQVCRSQTCVDQQTRQQELQLEVPLAQEPRSNITRVQILHQLLPDGSAVMQGGQILRGLDAVVYCTGYKHSYPWLEHLDIVQFGEWLPVQLKVLLLCTWVCLFPQFKAVNQCCRAQATWSGCSRQHLVPLSGLSGSSYLQMPSLTALRAFSHSHFRRI